MTLQTQAPTVGAHPVQAVEDRAYSKVFWRIVPFLMLCYVVAYLDRVNVGFAKLQMSSELGLRKQPTASVLASSLSAIFCSRCRATSS